MTLNQIFQGVSLMPTLINRLDQLIALTQKGTQTMTALSDQINRLSADEDKILALLQADQANTAALTAAGATKDQQIAALQAQVQTLQASGSQSDAASAALLQPLIDKLEAETNPPAGSSASSASSSTDGTVAPAGS